MLELEIEVQQVSFTHRESKNQYMQTPGHLDTAAQSKHKVGGDIKRQSIPSQPCPTSLKYFILLAASDQSTYGTTFSFGLPLRLNVGIDEGMDER